MTRNITVALGVVASLAVSDAWQGNELLRPSNSAVGVGRINDGPDSASLGQSNVSFRKYSGETIVRWNSNAITMLAGTPPDRFTRDLAMVHLAAHDAVNVVTPEYETYALDRKSSRHRPGHANPALAAAAAAHDVLVALWPDRQALIDGMLQVDIDAAHPSRRDRSLEIGAAAAHAIVMARANDGLDAVVPYTFGPPNPPVYQPVPPLGAIVVGTQVPFMTPFVLDSANRFRPAAPPDLASAKWARDYNEVKAYGRVDSAVRTANQTDAARFFFELSTLLWNRVASEVAAQDDRGLWTTARVFALINASLMDGAIATFDSKYHYNFWRPFTAIHAIDDGNASTDPDSTWTPLGVTPPHPEYVAGHASQSAAASVALTAIYGAKVSFRTTSTTSPSIRSYDSFDDLVVEIANSRIWAGFHYRTSVYAGMVQGYGVGRYVMANALQKVDDR
jgi:PAP2 superfamily